MTKFVRVKVANGRKFRGEAYDVGNESYTNTYRLPGWSGRGGWVESHSLKLWSPSQGWVYANPSYIEVVDCDAATIDADRAAYVGFVVDGTVNWCRSKSAGKSEDEVLRFARNVIKKHHPEMLEAFEKKYNPPKEDVAVITTNTLDWAFKLGYSNAKAVRTAIKALTKKGLMGNLDFFPSWTIWLDLRGLSRLVTKYLPDGIREEAVKLI